MEYLKAFNSLLFPSRNLCYYCREKSPNIVACLCEDCKKNIEIVNREILLDTAYIENIYYVTVYNKFMRKIIQEFKFHGKSYLYKALAPIITDNIKAFDLDIDIIFYVPSHRKKEAKRGYNQSQLLSTYVGKHIEKPISHQNLIKIRNTREQNKMDKIKRMTNVKDSFKLRDRRQVENKKILLIDDIITTGFTIIECSKILMENGAKSVVALGLTSSHKL